MPNYKLMTMILLDIGALLIAPSALSNDGPAGLELSIPGRIEGTGAYFEITDSEYLNVVLQSTKEIIVLLESVPKTISLNIEASTSSNSSNLTIGNLEPNTTYSKFEDSYKNEAVFVSDSQGSYTWTQDLTQPHHIWFQPGENGTIFLPEDCSNYGIWNATTSTCTLTQNLTESVEITANNITLDCAGHKITGITTGGYGIYLSRKADVILKNCAVNNFSYGIYLWGGSNHTLSNNNASNNSAYGILLGGSNYNTLVNNTVSLTQGYGILINNSINNTLTGNAMSGNKYNFYLWGAYDTLYDHAIDTTNVVDGKPIYYLLNVSNQIYDSSTNAGTFYCISCNNVTIKDLTLTNNAHGVFFWKTNNSKIENVTTSDNLVGIWLQHSSGNTLVNNIAKLNTWHGAFLAYSNNNTFTSNTFSLNSDAGVRLHSSASNTFTDNNINNNQYGLYIYHFSNAKAYHNNFVNNPAQVAIVSWSGGIFDNNLPDGGNYWSDYVGIDEKSGLNQDEPGADGIGDTPYTFTGGQDRYPWIRQDGWKGPPVQEFDVGVILAEPADVNHIATAVTEQPCKLIPEKTYSNGRSKEYYEDLAYCVADYHKENSFETVNLNFTIYDNDGQWFKTDKTENDYLGKEDEFVIDAINLAVNKGVDLSGKDMVIVIHASTSAQRIENKLTTGTWSLQTQPLGYPPYKIIAAENDPVGAWAHEIGHIIGALLTPENTIIPDLYDMGFSSAFTLFGKRVDILFNGTWDLMAEGSWNDSGINPPYMSSYTKEFLQWLNYDIHPKSAYGEYWIDSLETSKLGDIVFRYNLSDDANDESPEYYILEARNRNLKIWDSSLREEKALVLYRVDTHNFSEYGYDEAGWMWNKYRSIAIPGGVREYLVNDGVLTPDGETYFDFNNLVKFTALTDRTTDVKYEIRAGIEEITYDSFEDNFWGVILKPTSFFRQKIKETPPFNPMQTLESDKPENSLPNKQLTILEFNPETGKWEGGLSPPARGITKKEIVQYALVILSFFFLLIISLFWLNKKVTLRLKSERKRKIIKIFIKIFLIISIIFVVLLSLLTGALISEMPDYSDSNNSGGITTPSLLPLVFPDLDLHLYCNDGRHIGPNHETGEYDLQIPDAIVSGDNQNSPEWILIPANITNCSFAVSSRDNQQFLVENPDIAQQLEDTADSYEIYARYIDPETAIYTSTVLSEDIQAGQELEHPISGTEDIATEQGKPTINTLRHEIANARQLNLIDSDGIVTSLLAKLDTAEKQLKEDKTKTANNTLNALKNEVKSQKGKHIAEDTANLLIRDIQELTTSISPASANNLSLLLADIHTAITRLITLLSQLINAI